LVKMKAALLYGIEDLRLEEIEVPEVGPGEILARIRAATTCGTDLKIYRRGYVSGVIDVPTVFGHEWAGDVVDVGEGVERFKKGSRIRAGNSAPCYLCPPCREKLYNLCENRTWLWGAYAEYIKVPASIVKHNSQIVPTHVDYAEAAITEPLACVIHGERKAGIKVGDVIVIIGAGPIGLLHLLTARRLGAREVIVIDPIEGRLNMAERLGASYVVNTNEEDSGDAVKRLTKGRGADVVVEAVGLPSTWEQALKMVKKGGTVLEFGGCPPGTEIRIETELLHYNEVTVLGTFHADPHDFEIALNLISSKAVDVKPLITRRMKLDDINEAFRLLLTSKNDLKIALIP